MKKRFAIVVALWLVTGWFLGFSTVYFESVWEALVKMSALPFLLPVGVVGFVPRAYEMPAAVFAYAVALTLSGTAVCSSKAKVYVTAIALLALFLAACALGFMFAAWASC